jgi:LacI family transcriptional regulator
MLGCSVVVSPRVLIVLNAHAAWSRGILKGFTGFALEAGWTLLHYHPSADLDWLVREWKPDAAVLPFGYPREFPAFARSLRVVAVNDDRTDQGIPSVIPDEKAIGEIAANHLAGKGLHHFSTFRFTNHPFAIAREQSFFQQVAKRKGHLAPGWWQDGANPPSSEEQPLAFVTWLRNLPKPCGIFACCDSWARVVARYCKVAEIRIPDEVALLGVDNDVFECELLSPPLSSVAVPWHTLGQEAARLTQLRLAGRSTDGSRVVIPPLDVVARRSTEVLAISDPLVQSAVRFICENATQRIDVPAVVRAVAASRQRLERRFHAVLGHTVMQEIRRARVNTAKQLLSTTSLDMSKIAKLSGFTNQALMSVAFSRELGKPPSAYRRTLKRLQLGDD